MNEDFYISLIYKNLEGSISEKELEQLKIWLSQSPDNQLLANNLALAYEGSESYMAAEGEAVDIDAAWKEQLNLLELEASQEKVIPIHQNKAKGGQTLWKVGIAAAIAALLILTYQYYEIRTQIEAVVSSENTTKTVAFVDGSTAVLAPNSMIKYNNYFNEKGRYVELVKGSATFSVVKEKGQFRVKTPSELVTVLGTIFNVTLDSNQTTVSVSEGKVSVQQIAKKKGDLAFKSIVLVAGESVVNTGRDLIKQGQESKAKPNFFDFQNATLSSIIPQLENHFETPITLSPALENCRITITLDHQTLDNALTLIDKLVGSTHQKTREGITIIGDSCQ